MIFSRDFNLFFDTNYEAQCGNSTLKKISVAKLIHIKESQELCDIWRVRNLKKKQFTFRKIRNSGFTQRRLDYFLVSNILQEFIKKVYMLTSVSTDHSEIFCSSSKIQKQQGETAYQNSTILYAAILITLLNEKII